MSRLLADIPKRRRILVEIKIDGSAKTFVYKDLDEKVKSNIVIKLINYLKRFIK